MSETPQPAPEQQAGFIGRPSGQLHDYPVEVRWEVSRRHPYYLVFWNDALLYRQSEPDDQSPQALIRHAATIILSAIGVTGEPVAPETDFANLFEGDSNPAFLTGTVQPMTFRAIVSMLVHWLPPTVIADVGSILKVASDDTYAVPNDNDKRFFQERVALGNLARLASPTLDSFPSIPLFYVHLGASQRSITRDIEDQVRR